MIETPPIPNSAAQPKTSPLAIWSLVLGILSVTCFSIFSGIPAVICGHKALSKIKRSAGMLAGDGLAIAGLVTGYLGIVLALTMIPMMAGIAIPNFVKARSQAQNISCINNLRQIDGAKSQWALENKKESTDIPTQGDLRVYLHNNQFPTCPAGGVYQINPVGQAPTCSMPNHQIRK